MQGAPPPWDDTEQFTAEQPPSSVQVAGGFVPMNEGSFLSGTTQMAPGQIIMLQPPSGAPKVIGILAIIWGVLNFGSSLFGFLTPMPGLLMVLNVVSLGLGGATIAGGVMAMNYQRRGIMLLLLTIVLGTVAGGIELANTEALYDEMLEDDQITQEQYDVVTANSGLVEGVGLVLLAVCNGVCGFIIAIPLLVNNNGLDDSKLFGSI